MKEIKLNKGKYALVDGDDFGKVNQYEWKALKRSHGNNKFDVIRNETIDGKKKIIYMHRFIMNPENSKIQVDHINGNGFDNRKCNLRLCSNSQNNMNKQKRSDNTSGYKGVSFYKGKFYAEIMKEQTPYKLGTFKTALEAAKAYNAKALELHGEFARLNEI